MTKQPLCEECKVEHRSHRSKLCSDCIKKKREANREHIKRDVLGIRKRSDLEKEWAEKRKIKVNIMPYQQPRRRYYMSISNVEKQVLFKKYVRDGMSYEEADKKVKSTLGYLQDLMENLRFKIKSEKELEIRFKEEFSKLLMTHSHTLKDRVS